MWSNIAPFVNNINIKYKVVLVGIVVGLLVGVVIIYSQGRIPDILPDSDTTAVSTVMVQHGSSELLTRETMIDTADMIFTGQVRNVSATSWNQDNGEYWEDGFLLHTLEIQILQLIAADENRTGEQNIVITVLGNSPLEEHNEYHLQTGDEAVFFIKETEIAWREGNKTVNSLLGVPSNSYFLLGKDGFYHGREDETPISLEELIKQISNRRELLLQP